MSITADSTVMLAALEPHHLVLQAIGALGSLIYVGSYLLVQCGHICGNSMLDTSCKLLAALCVMVSLATAFNLATFLIQISFIAISIFGLWYRISGRFAARRSRQAHILAKRQEYLPGVEAYMPGESASNPPAVQQPGLPRGRG
ncbi:MAG: hypothetical protein GVY34_09595 [Alphaproteobacteria bacterium]|jgi:hypothetical protein|nr:hypothetical protein [Alphaproteobacteria bacterium]